MELKEVNFKVVECKNILINHKREIILQISALTSLKNFLYDDGHNKES